MCRWTNKRASDSERRRKNDQIVKICNRPQFIRRNIFNLLQNSRLLVMSGAAKRGALIVFEGCDRSGKTTQVSMTLEFSMCFYLYIIPRIEKNPPIRFIDRWKDLWKLWTREAVRQKWCGKEQWPLVSFMWWTSYFQVSRPHHRHRLCDQLVPHL